MIIRVQFTVIRVKTKKDNLNKNLQSDGRTESI